MIERRFPRLGQSGYQITSPESPRYNCIAWAAHENDRWWWPDPLQVSYWPPQVPREETVDALILAFRTLGYAPCDDGSQEPGFEKVAIYANPAGKPTHAARQLTSGKWTSKLGRDKDIVHELEGLTGTLYGAVIQFLKLPLAR